MNHQYVILAVDDDRAAHDMFQAALAPYGITTRFTVNTDDAFELMSQFVPDLIIMDLLLPRPGVSGWQAIQKIKSDERFKHVPVIAITAADREFVQKAIQAGCDEVIRKPFNISQVRETIRKWLEKAQA